jgi:putative hydrolase of the HAD superfamily
MSDKQEVDYSDLIRRLEIKPSEFFKFPKIWRFTGFSYWRTCRTHFHTTWAHEKIDHK